MKRILLPIAIIAGLTACNKVDTPSTTATPKTYTMSVAARKGDYDMTRSLHLGYMLLNTRWTAGETVDVYAVTSGDRIEDPAVYTKVGTLTAITDGSTTTLTGTVTFSGKPRLELYYGSPSWTYEGQKGTIADISDNYDYSMVSLTSNKYDIEDGAITLKNSPLSFSNMQAIVRFTLEDPDGNNITASSLTLEARGSQWFHMTHNHETTATSNKDSFTVTPDAPTSEFFVAMRSINKFALRLKTSAGMYEYTYDDAEATFDRSKYYEVRVKMQKTRIPATIDLASITKDLTLIDGDVLTGTLSRGYKISIEDDAAVTLNDVTIPGGCYLETPWAGITCLGDASITLIGTNTVRGYLDHYPGIQAGPSGTTLTIQGNGSLTVTYGGDSRGSLAAGIGGGKDQHVGNIVITGGDITATGSGSAGIGSGFSTTLGSGVSCGNITITGGTVRATSNSGGAGIGSGMGPESYVASCGDITITGGTVIAVGGDCGAGIGSGTCSNGNGGSYCGNITITGGNITATGGSSILGGDKVGAAGIGTGYQAHCGNITIGGTAKGTATHGEFNFHICYDIGPGCNGICKGTISVAPGTISGNYP